MSLFLSFHIFLFLFIINLHLHSIVMTGFDPDLNQAQEDGQLVTSLMGNESTIHELKVYRLPPNLVPSIYHLTLQPILPPLINLNQNSGNESELDFSENFDLDLFTVPGHVTIRFTCITSTNQIILNCLDIFIQETSVKIITVETEQVVEVMGHEFDEEQEFYTVLVNPRLEQGQEYEISINFTTQMTQNEGSLGIFAHSYTIPMTVEERWTVATRLQAIEARKVFPCFDEPEYKAIFKIKIGRQTGYHSLSNGKLIESIKDPILKDWYWDEFESSLKMSTYLVCIVVSDFVSQNASFVIEDTGSNLTESTANKTKPIRIWGPLHTMERGSGLYASQLTSKIIKKFENIFKIKDDTPKFDLAMIPRFDTAMENWGLITFSESRLLYNPLKNSQYERLMVSLTIAHEIAHNFFGNKVTCHWWSDLWLNEGLTNFWASKVLKTILPEVDWLHQYVHADIQESMKVDLLDTAKPLKMLNVSTRLQIMEMFDIQTYRKGSSMVYMLKSFLGDQIFLEGLQNYLKKFSYKTVTQDDLFNEFNTLATSILPVGVTISNIMKTWTLESGRPLVRVHLSSPNEIKLTQEVFKHYYGNLTFNENPKRWWIPIKISSETEPRDPNVTWFSPYESSTTIKINGSWIVVNPDYAAYISVLYDPALTFMIQKQLEKNHQVFSALTRSQILFDYISFWKADLISLESLLNLMTYVGQESEYLIWRTLTPLFHKFDDKLKASQHYHALFCNFLAPKLESVLQSSQVGLEGDSGEDPTKLFLRSDLLQLAFHVDSPLLFNYSLTFFHKWRAHPEIFPLIPDAYYMEPVVLCGMVQSGGATVWEFIYEQTLKNFTTNRWLSDHRDLFYYLSCASTPELINRTLNLIQNYTRRHAYTLLEMANNKATFNTLFNFILNNYARDNSTLVKPKVFYHVMDKLGQHLYKKEDTLKLTKFLQQHEETLKATLGHGKWQQLQKIVDKMNTNREWFEEGNGLKLRNWLQCKVHPCAGHSCE